MRDRSLWSTWRPVSAALVALVIIAGSAWGQQPSSKDQPKDSSKDQSQSRDQNRDQNRDQSRDQNRDQSRDQNRDQSRDQNRDSGPVVRTFGKEGDYRTEVRTEVKGKLTDEDRRQASLLTMEVFQHIDKANQAVEADDTKGALKDVNKGREAIKAIRAMLPKANIHTRTTAPDGKAIFEDDYEVQESRIPLFEGLLHTQTLAPIVEARRNAMEVAGVHVVEAETIVTAAMADIDPIEAHLARAAKYLEQDKDEDAAKALAQTLIRGIELRYTKEDKELVSARDSIWLARRSLEENNVTQALVNLEVARQRLRIYREVVSQDQQREVDQMLREVEQLEAQLRSEGNRTVARNELARQGTTVTHWWDRINGWFHHR
jgi:hypothetical protein